MIRLAAALALLAACSVSGQAPSPPEAPATLPPPLAAVLEVLHAHFPELNETNAWREAAQGLVRAADPRGRFVDDAEAEEVRRSEEGIGFDPGLSLTISNGYPYVTAVATNSAAARAGIAPGAILRAVDGVTVSNTFVTQVLGSLRQGSRPVRLSLTDPAGEERDVELTLSAAPMPAVDQAIALPLGLCYLRINGLYADSGTKIAALLHRWQAAKKAGLVLDLRGAGGADADSVAEIASAFTSAGTPLFTFLDTAGKKLDARTASASSRVDMPAMVLVDGDTTGAAEVLAAVLAHSVHGAMLVGSATTGNFLLRETLTLPDGRRLRIATRRLEVGKDRVYTGAAGLEPAVEVDTARPMPPEIEPPLDARGLRDEEREARKLRTWMRSDPCLRRAVNILLGLKALNIRGFTSDTDAVR